MWRWVWAPYLGCAQSVYSYQINLDVQGPALEQPAGVVMVGITLCVSYIAFTVSFYFGGFLTIQELGESHTITSFCSCACWGLELFTESVTQQNENIPLLHSLWKTNAFLSEPVPGSLGEHKPALKCRLLCSCFFPLSVWCLGGAGD